MTGESSRFAFSTIFVVEYDKAGLAITCMFPPINGTTVRVTLTILWIVSYNMIFKDLETDAEFDGQFFQLKVRELMLDVSGTCNRFLDKICSFWVEKFVVGVRLCKNQFS